jgi:hypothetical protein
MAAVRRGIEPSPLIGEPVTSALRDHDTAFQLFATPQMTCIIVRLQSNAVVEKASERPSAGSKSNRTKRCSGHVRAILAAKDVRIDMSA